MLPPPRVMFAGIRGSGVKTQLQMLSDKYEIPILNLEKNIKYQLNFEAKKRREQRYYLRGFKAPEYDDEGNLQEDQELEQEKEDFDRKQQELTTLEYICNHMSEVFINANFLDNETIQTPLIELLTESKRLPEVMIIFKVDEKNMIKRQFDESLVKQEYQKNYNEYVNKKKQEIQDAKQQLMDENEGQLPEDYVEPEFVIDEEDPDLPNFKNMSEEKQKILIEQREADNAKCDEYIEQLQNLKVDVHTISCERSVENTFKKVLFHLQNYLENRQNIIEKQRIYNIKDTEEIKNRTKNYQNFYAFKESRHQRKDLLQRLDLNIHLQNSFIYNDLIYYVIEEDQLEDITNKPLQYIQQETYPSDINCKPKLFVIGGTSTGKKTLCQNLQKEINIVIIDINELTSKQYLQNHECFLSQLALSQLPDIQDDTKVQLIKLRISQSDCIQNGWILQSFPQTLEQAQILREYNILPDLVISLKLPYSEVKLRFEQNQYNELDKQKKIITKKIQKQIQEAEENGEVDEKEFDEDGNEIIKEKIDKFLEVKEYEESQKKEILNKLDQINQQLYVEKYEQEQIQSYYQQTYNNVKYINTKTSKWGVKDNTLELIYKCIQTKQQLSKALVTNGPADISLIPLNEDQIIYNLNPQFQNYSPVAYKTSKKLSKLPIRGSSIVYYDKFVYLLQNKKEIDDFIKNPEKYVFQPISDVVDTLQIDEFINLQDKTEFKKQEDTYCVVQLAKKQLNKCFNDHFIQYKDKLYNFSNVQSMKQFAENPHQYLQVQIFDKIPVSSFSSKIIKKVAKKEQDCSAFLEMQMGNICMRILAKLGYERLKYPTLSCKETALKFLAICLKAFNQNKDQNYRNKYQAKLDDFLRHCNYCNEIQQQQALKQLQGEYWKHWQEENLLKISQDFKDFIGILQLKDKEEYFEQFIR